MKHIDLRSHEEAIKQFFLALPADADGSMVELDGKPIARITPINAATDQCGEGTDWNDQKNARRCELVDRDIAGTLLADEAAELAVLQQQLLAERRRRAPVALSDLRRLHQELLAKAQRAGNGNR